MEQSNHLLQLSAVQAAAEHIAGQVLRTPCVRSQTLSAMLGVELYLKLENHQFTASFKERGALNWLLSLPPAARQRGVIAVSAGNHAQAVAYHAARLDVPAVIVMPRSTPNAKVEQTKVFGPEVHLVGETLDEAMQRTEALVAERNLTLAHPFNDDRVIAGQGTVGLELLEQAPGLDAVLVPVGGGGLIGGMGAAIKGLAPSVRLFGVQMERFSAAHDRYHGLADRRSRPLGTVAEGIAVKAPGDRSWPLIAAHVDGFFQVSEVAVEQSVFTLLEIEKTVAEGAGAAALAALTANAAHFQGQRVAVVVSGGNIDMMILSSLLQRGLVRDSRLVRLVIEIPDLPGALGALTSALGRLDSNIVEIVHQRAFGASSVRATVVELVLQMRGEEQSSQVLDALKAQGYPAELREG